MTIRVLMALLGIVCVGLVNAQNDVGKFSSYGINDGLSQSTVVHIFQDKKGFIWLGTSDGLNRFDGRNFANYKNKHSNNNSLSDSWIVRILMEDSENNLWILTSDRAINKFNLRTNEFKRYIPNSSDSTAIQPFQGFYSIVEDSLKNIWMTTNTGIYKFLFPDYKVINYVKEISKKYTKKNLILWTFKDFKGNLWSGSTLGLSKYNYKTTKFIKYNAEGIGLKGLPAGRIIAPMLDCNKQLWFLNASGLTLYNDAKDNFIFYPYKGIKINADAKIINTYFTDNINCIWIGTSQGLVRFNIPLKKYQLFTHNTNKLQSISDNYVTKIFENSKGELWVGTINGLNQFDSGTLSFKSYFQKPGNTADNFISDIIELRSTGELWVLGKMDPSGGGFLSKVDRRRNYLINFINNPCDQNSIACSYVFLPLVDNTGNLWLGSFGDGAVKYSPRISNFYHYRNVSDDPTSNSSVWGFGEDPKGNIWVASYDKGFSKFDTKTRVFKNYKPKVIIAKKPIDYYVMSVCPDFKGQIWVATIGAGLIRFDPQSGKSRNFLSKGLNSEGISSNSIRLMTIGKTGKLLLAHGDSGINIFDPVTEKVEKLKNNPLDKNSLPNNSVWYILSDKAQNLWISTDGFVSYYNTKNHRFTNYQAGVNTTNGIPADKALSIFESSSGDVWFGTSGGGLSNFNPKTKTFTTYSEEDGLSNGVVYGITEDSAGFLWLSTNKGLSKFNPKNKTFKNYEESAGLQSNEFNAGAFFKSRSNKMYFGGINGFNEFDPLKISDDTISPQTVLTGFQINNKTITIIEPSMRKHLKVNNQNALFFTNSSYYLPSNIAYLKSLTLPYKVKVFSIEFAALLYNSPEKCTFRYMMVDFDDVWNYSGTRNYASYTNLSPGTYTFRVQSANSDGFWSKKTAEIQIIIVPPFWKTWWFITILILFTFILIRLYILMRERNLHKAKTLLEERVKKRTLQIEEKNEELQLRTIEISKQKEEIAFQAKQLKSELLHHNQSSEIDLLRSQINPHFLFNTLNNIYSLVYQKSDDAPTAVMKLSEIMRYMLYDANADKVPLEKELNYLKSFIELQVLRLKNRDCVEYSVTGNIYGKMIAPMLFIAFVENAFKHGNKKSENPCIIINLALNEQNIVFDIVNQYQKSESVNKDETGGIGLANVRRRLELLYPTTHKLRIENAEGKFHVNLELTLNDN